MRQGKSPVPPPKPRTRTGHATKVGEEIPATATRQKLLDAARAEFDEKGFEGTDTNRIARRAGFAPQTFYRHFADKTAIFVESYRAWLGDEWKDLDRARGRGAEEAARITLAHHARHREFRRSLRRLTVTDPAVRAARAESRRAQIASIAEEDATRGRARSDATRAALVLCIERIADAAADGELTDLGIPPKDQAAMLADILRRFAR
jgi:AcrR family transcriptional regulator